MDPDRKATLDLIEVTVAGMSVEVRGKQLLHVVRDYLDDGDTIYARKVLARIDRAYFDEHLFKNTAEDSLFAEAVAVIVDIFGVDLHLFRTSQGSA